MGCIYRNQQGTGKSQNWFLKFKDKDGKTVIESSKTTDRKKANDLLRTREQDVEDGLEVGTQWRFEDAAADLINDYEINDRATTGNTQRRIDLHLQPFFGGQLVKRITTEDIRRFTKERKQAGASNAEINRELAALRRMLRLAVQSRRIAACPFFPMLDESKNVRKGFFEHEHFEAISRHLPAWWQPVIAFGYFTGWRIQSEVLPLQWTNVDLTAGVITLDVGSTKNGDGRTFPYRKLPGLAAVIDEQVRQRDALRKAGTICPLVFHHDGQSLLSDSPSTDDDGPKAIREYRVAWRAACAAVGLPGKIPHDFRRTAVRNLERAGVPRSVAMKLTGHKTESVYRRYAIVNENDLSEGVAKLAKVANGKG